VLNQYPVGMLNVNRREVPDNGIDDESNHYIDDVYGINAERTGDVQPDSDYEFWQHGDEVTALAVGGSLRTIYPDLDQLLRIRPIKVVRAIPSSDASPQYEITESALIESVRYAAQSGGVANVSISSTEPLAAIEENIRSSPSLVVVVAAGNLPEELDDSPAYPAMYAGSEKIGSQVITVAAATPQRELATFSNFSPTYVDIAAPGCGFTISQSAASAPLEGTSFAAPLVTFAVGLLRTLGITQPSDIKERLNAGGDYSPALEGKVRFASVLNLAKTIAVYDDVLELDSGGSLLMGAWQNGGTVPMCDQQPDIPISRIRKITKIGFDSATKKLMFRILKADAGGRVSVRECKGVDQPIIFKSTDADTEQHFTWSQVKDLVPSYYRN